MSDDRHFEENLSRLMAAAVGPAARPSGEARERLRQHVLDQLRARQSAPEFPVGIILALAGFVAVLGGFLVADAFGAIAAGPANALLALPLGPRLVLILNILWVPIAAATIVMRNRRYVY